MNITLRVLLSLVFAALGVTGLIMPILPGWIFFAFVGMLLFPDARLTRSGAALVERHFPSARRLLRVFLPPQAE